MAGLRQRIAEQRATSPPPTCRPRRPSSSTSGSSAGTASARGALTQRRAVRVSPTTCARGRRALARRASAPVAVGARSPSGLRGRAAPARRAASTAAAPSAPAASCATAHAGAARVDAEPLVERPATSGPSAAIANGGRHEDQVVLEAAARDPDALVGVDLARPRRSSTPVHGARADRREEPRDEQQPAARLARARHGGVGLRPAAGPSPSKAPPVASNP